QKIQSIEKFLVAHVFGPGLFPYKRESSAGLENALVDFRERFKSLLPRRGFELWHGNELALQMLSAHLAILDQRLSLAFDKLVKFLMAIQETNNQVGRDEQGNFSDDSPKHTVIFSDDGVLHGI